LHVGALLLGLFGEFSGSEQRRAVNPVAACLCADINYGIANAFGFGEKDFFFFRDAESEGIDQRVLRVARLEGDFAADGGNAETISVASDAANYAVENAPILRGVLFGRVFTRRDFAEAEGIENGDGTRPHGENIAQNATDAGRRSLKGLDVTRMIVRFDFEGGNEAVADVHDTSVFTRALHDEFAARGQSLQVDLAGFVGAVLAPHHAENAQFGDVWVAAKDLLDARVFLARDAMLGGDLRSDSNFGAGSGHIQISEKNWKPLTLSPLRRRRALRSWSEK
jgi:hypothetical protein